MAVEISHWFPPEITSEILLKLPVISLLRCKSVCKDWFSLISDQNFIKSHYTLSSTNIINYHRHRLIYTTLRQRKNLYSCPLYDVLFNGFVNNAIQLENLLQRPESHGVMIVGSCNGLVCLSVDVDNVLFIYNPTTRKLNLLPCFQQTESSMVYYGFGYDELSHDYKVIMTIRHNKATMMYSLKTRKWKAIGQFPYFCPLDNGKLLNGSLHWAAGKSSWSDTWKIVSLDLQKETYGDILQAGYRKGHNYLNLGVLGEWLCVLYNYYESCVVDVWVMKVYGVKDSWTKLASIPYPPHQMSNICAPLCISGDGKLLLKSGLQFLVYDSKDSSSLVIDNKCSDACIVVESLVSPLGLADMNGDED